MPKIIFRPARITPDDRRYADALSQQFSPSQRSFLQRFRVFVEINNIQRSPLFRQAALVAGQMSRLRLKASSIATYVRTIADAYLTSAPYSHVIMTRRLAKRIEYKGRNQPVKRAPVMTSAQLHTARHAPASPLVRATIALIYVGCLRLADVQDINPANIHFTDRFVKIRIVGGKTVRSRLEHFTIQMPLIDLTSAEQKALRWASRQTLLAISHAELNGFLRALLGRCHTGYSIRNLRIVQLIKAHTNSQGLVDWAAIQAVTHHKSPKTLKAFYDSL